MLAERDDVARATCIRLSVCNWQTTAEDVDRSVAALVRAAAEARAGGARPAGRALTG